MLGVMILFVTDFPLRSLARSKTRFCRLARELPNPDAGAAEEEGADRDGPRLQNDLACRTSNAASGPPVRLDRVRIETQGIGRDDQQAHQSDEQTQQSAARRTMELECLYEPAGDGGPSAAHNQEDFTMILVEKGAELPSRA
jgi:hypothetical protein